MSNKHKPFSMHLDVSDFLPADKEEKQSLVIMRESVGFWRDGARRFKKNKIAMTSLIIIILVFIFSFILPSFYPYAYEQQIRGSENLSPFQYSEAELERMAAGESVFPHFLGTDSLGRDITARLMMGSRISLLVGLVASILVLIIGSLYGSIAGYFGGKVDMIMMRVVDIIYTVPDILIIILLMVTLKYPLQDLANNVPGFAWINTIGIGLISIFIVFSLLYWVGMARIVRGQILTLKEQEYVTAARALGASHRRIIGKHLLTNCMGPLIVTTTLQIPSAIFTESFLSFIGIGVQAPMPSLGSMAANAIGGIYSYPHRLFAPAIMISLIILSFNLLGDGLRDAFDPKLKN
ncbi:MAG: ABC transporter permease [Clostridiaceae bacterium]|jgi:oligopeptide transport system permease protein|nr:ABC transporter permease [Bacillota bacterium]NLI38415.1 ABC transporter permease [Clostridiaceae bacterium]